MVCLGAGIDQGPGSSSQRDSTSLLLEIAVPAHGLHHQAILAGAKFPARIVLVPTERKVGQDERASILEEGLLTTPESNYLLNKEEQKPQRRRLM